MSSLNKVILIGNVGNEPEVRTTNSGTKVAQMNLATSRKWKDSSGTAQEKTEWHKCVVWNRGKSTLADVVERYVGKGDKVCVEGTIEYRQYEDKEKQTRYITEINVASIVLLGGGKRAEKGDRSDKLRDEFEDPFGDDPF